VCGCHFSFAAVMTCTCVLSFNMYLLLAQIDNNNNINAHFGYVHHVNNSFPSLYINLLLAQIDNINQSFLMRTLATFIT
jgi:hypothetical protein